jgi:hypothetical protein
MKKIYEIFFKLGLRDLQDLVYFSITLPLSLSRCPRQISPWPCPAASWYDFIPKIPILT